MLLFASTLTGFSMDRILFETGRILSEFQSFRVSPFVLGCRVIAIAAFRTRQCNRDSHRSSLLSALVHSRAGLNPIANAIGLSPNG